ncbi:hypothetical protein A1O1_01417 [Capronia coronata CBS 617.96]|uniref:Thioesterase domain-containing protein n=1 Tax=Capronia coronata CBS 617.96 TaxID=1182541 RepID=W9Z3X4_9EURO|nr:uncharacterized protein A1O1_01417 [Capronia coronata CBS 617.96]EXJ96291.1 hypothetical protein A1O1_01417 [Capronia coronata CBS 617.96]
MGEQTDFMSNFLKKNRVPEESRRHFASVEWTNKYLSDPLYKPIPTFSRVLKESGEDHFFARTVSTPATIPHLVTLQLKNFETPPEVPKGTLKGKESQTAVTRVPEKPDCVMLLSLGRPGLDGHPRIIHGGMACAILDEMIGLCLMLHHQHICGPRDSLFTVNLNVTFRAPVPTPGDVLVKTWVVAREGRKWLAHGQIIDKDGVVLTEAEGLWVLAKRQEKL